MSAEPDGVGGPVQVRVGQVWASNDYRDLALKHNQRCKVVEVTDTHVVFDGRPRREVRHNGVEVLRHRLVAEAPNG